MDQYTIPIDALPTDLKEKLDASQVLNHRERAMLLQVILNDIGMIRARSHVILRLVVGTLIQTWPHLGGGIRGNMHEAIEAWVIQLNNMQRNMTRSSHVNGGRSVAQVRQAVADRRIRRQILIDWNNVSAG